MAHIATLQIRSAGQAKTADGRVHNHKRSEAQSVGRGLLGDSSV